LLTDILALFAANPLRPAYLPRRSEPSTAAPDPVRWIDYDGGVLDIGHAGDGYAWDNELPRHKALVHPFRLADRLVTNSEWQEFMPAGGYRPASLWLGDGWNLINREGWRGPLYWEERDGGWKQMTLAGLVAIEPAAPVCNVSYYEADAYARWSGKRL